jgi:hypothetical protein
MSKIIYDDKQKKKMFLFKNKNEITVYFLITSYLTSNFLPN